MARVLRSPRAKNDIKRILQYTLKKWGEAQAWEYSALIEEALETIAITPERGKQVTSGQPGILRHHIAQTGRNARHVIFYG